MAGRSLKAGRLTRKEAASKGHLQRSSGDKFVGWEVHLKWWAVVVVGFANAVLVVLQSGAVARPKLSESGPSLAREVGFLRVDFRSRGIQDPIIGEVGDGVSDNFRVDLVDGF